MSTPHSMEGIRWCPRIGFLSTSGMGGKDVIGSGTTISSVARVTNPMDRGTKRGGEKETQPGLIPMLPREKRNPWSPPPSHVTPGSGPTSRSLSTVQLVPEPHVIGPGRPVLRATDARAPLGRVFPRIDPDVWSSAAEDRKRQAGGSPSLSPRRIWDEWFVCAGNGGRSNSHGARASQTRVER